MLQVEMSASTRNETGKGSMRRLRMQGKTPAVVYGAGVDNVTLTFETQPLFQKLLEISRTNAVVTLKIDGGSEKSVILKEVQTDPVKDTLVHADFLEIDLKKERQFSVPLVFNGIAKGCDLGGEMNSHIDTVLLEGFPLEIPNEFEIDVTALEIGDKIHVESLVIPEGIKLVTDKKAICVAIDKPGAVEEDEETEEVEEEATEEAAPATEE